jgi:hypothetical protein
METYLSSKWLAIIRLYAQLTIMAKTRTTYRTGVIMVAMVDGKAIIELETRSWHSHAAELWFSSR